MNTLFDPPSAPTNGTPTSAVAAAKVARSGRADSDRNRIVVYLHSRPDGATRHELAEALGIGGDSLRPRVYELMGRHDTYRDDPPVRAMVRGGQAVRRTFKHHGTSEVLIHRRFDYEPAVKAGAA